MSKMTSLLSPKLSCVCKCPCAAYRSQYFLSVVSSGGIALLICCHQRINAALHISRTALYQGHQIKITHSPHRGKYILEAGDCGSK